MARLAPDDRRREIVHAALRVARRKGLGPTTVRDVAAEMGTSSGLVHHYFDSMDDVLAAAFELAATADLDRAQAAVSAPADAATKLDRFIEHYAPATSDWTMQLWLDAWSEAARRPAVRRVSQRLNQQWQQLVRDVIVAGTDAGRFITADADASAWRLLSVLDGLALQVVAHASTIDRDDVVAWTKFAARRELQPGDGARDGEGGRSAT